MVKTDVEVGFGVWLKLGVGVGVPVKKCKNMESDCKKSVFW